MNDYLNGYVTPRIFKKYERNRKHLFLTNCYIDMHLVHERRNLLRWAQLCWALFFKKA